MKYRSKVVEIEARQLGHGYDEDLNIMKWCGGHFPIEDSEAENNGLFYITTLEGSMLASSSDWIIKGTEGEFYPCKDSVFRRKYEEVRDF